jgi:hypothetical protein
MSTFFYLSSISGATSRAAKTGETVTLFGSGFGRTQVAVNPNLAQSFAVPLAYSAQIFFFGAMFTRVYAQAHGWEPQTMPPQTSTMDAVITGLRPEERREAEPTTKVARFAAIGLALAALSGKRRRRSS